MSAPPELLYHYTTNEGLLGIASEKKIWATRALYLNDAKEIEHAFDVVRDLLPDVEVRNPSGTQFFRRYLDQTRIVPWIFLTAWTEDGDQLSQWRAYGRHGYSLGFERNALELAAREQGWRLEPCIYDMDEQKAVLRMTLHGFYESLELGELTNHEGAVLTSSDEYAEAFSAQLFGHLFQVASLLKHPAFVDEKEWRLISPVSSDLDIKHRAGVATLIPYATFSLPVRESILDIHETVIGPGPEDQRAHEGVASLYLKEQCGLDNAGVLRAHIRPSRIPYRYW